MSQPLVSGPYPASPPPSSESSPYSHQQPRLHGSTGPSLIRNRPSSSPSLSSEGRATSSSNGSGAAAPTKTFRSPTRLTPASTSGPSAPTLARTHIGAHSTNAGASTSSSLKRSIPSGKSSSNGLVASDIAGTSQPSTVSTCVPVSPPCPPTVAAPPPPPPPPPLAVEPTTPAGEEQGQAAPPPSAWNQVPTIAQRDALTSRVYSMCRSAGYDNWLHLLELAPLASQHHLSGYNCMKFGHQGSPYAYLPLSMQQPWQADALTEKQKVSESEAMAWLIQKRKRKLKLDEIDRGTKRGGGVLQDEGEGIRVRKVEEDGTDAGEGGSRPALFVATGVGPDASDDSPMREASSPPACLSNTDDAVEISGPLRNEVVMSQEWEQPIKEEVATGAPSTGEDPATSKLAEEGAVSGQQPASLAIKTSDSHPISISPIIPPELLVEVTRYVQMGLPECLRPPSSFEEVTTPHHADLQLKGKRLIRCHTTRVDLCEVAQRAEREMVEAAQAKRRPRLLSLQPSNQPSGFLETVCAREQLDDEEGDQDTSMIPLAFGGQYRGFTIGNLLLSSCPGKKVRLTGPVRGRGAICRNLGLDLKRIKQLGVAALVCCLDDEELEFLGAPWSLYEKEADQLGMEVIRLPMAEGFSPTDVSMTDNAISSIVEHFTLRGVNVLVHCRGGVGRAGLIACTWMLKLGLIRSDEDEAAFQRIIQGSTTSEGAKGGLSPPDDSQRENMQVIHRLIDTIRRRRSPKAIETAEQVAFLFKYVTYLRTQEQGRDACRTP